MQLSDEFMVQVVLHHGSVSNFLLFIIALEGLSRSECPEELLYSDDLAIISETLECLNERLEAWKRALESKWWRVNVKKTKIMNTVSRKDADSNSIMPVLLVLGT